MIIDRLIPAPLVQDVDERRRARLLIYAIGVAQLATILVALLLVNVGHQLTGLVVLSSTIPYLVVWGVLHATNSTRFAAYGFMLILTVVITVDFGNDSGHGILAGIALPVAGAALIGVSGAVVFTFVAVAWQVYFGPVVFRPDDFDLEAGMSAAVMTTVVGIATGVVERLREQAMLEAQNQRHKLHAYSDRIRHFAGSTFPAMMDFDSSGIRKVNDGFDRLLGYEAGAINDATITEFVHPDDLARVRSEILSASSGGFRIEMRMRHREGNWVWLEIFALPLPNETEFGWMLMARDAHDEIESRERLMQAQKLESVGTLAAGLAHDFNNLLTVVVGHATLLPEGEDRDQILEASDRATELIGSLRAFAQAQDMAPRNIDAITIVHRVTAMSKRLLGSRVTLVVASEIEHAPIRIEHGALDQLLLNLITNAKEAIEDSGTIEMRVSRRVDEDSAKIVIEVEDTGRGMDETTLQRAFEPFFTTKPIHQASGLGLASAYGIVKRAGGNILLQSEPGKGTLATIELPEVGDFTDELSDEVDLKQHRYDGQRCVLVEDDDAVRQTLNRNLSALGFSVYDADNATRGLALVDEHTPAFVVSDIVMPGVRGSEFAHQLRARYPQLPILLVSGYDQDKSTEAHKLDPLVRFLAKPVRMPDLARQLKTLEKAEPGRQAEIS